MMLLALLLFAQDAPAAEPVEEMPEITVIAQRLRSITANVGRDRRGRYMCSLNGTTGRPRLDSRLCRAVTDCVRQGQRERSDVHACLESEKATLLDEVRRELGDRR